MSQSGILDIVGGTPGIPVDFVTDDGTAVPSGNTLNVLGGSGIHTTGSGDTIHIIAGSPVTITYTEDTGTASPIDNNLNVKGLSGGSIHTEGTDDNITIAVSGTIPHSLQLGNTPGSLNNLGVATNGQLPIGSVGADPVLAVLTSTGHTIDITNGPGSINLETVGGRALDSLTPDVGGAVNASGGTIVVTSFPQSPSAKGVKTFNGGGNVFQISNLDAVTPYVVGKSDNTSAFTTIQSAINAASSDGASVSSPAIVYISPGIYVENLQLQPYIHLCGLIDGDSSAVKIEGSLNAQLIGSANAFICISNLEVANNAIAPCISLAANTGVFEFFMQYVTLIANSNSIGGLFSPGVGIVHINMSECTIEAGANTSCIIFSGTELNIYNSRFFYGGTSSQINGGTVNVYFSYMNDSFFCIGSTLNVYESFFDSGSLPCIFLGATANIQSCIMSSNSGSGNYIQSGGAGASLTYNDINPIGTAKKIASGIPVTTNQLQVGNLSFDGGTSILNANGEVWIGSVTGNPAPRTLTAGTGVTITNASNSITISASGGGSSWVLVTGSSQAIVIDTNYVADNATLVTFSLPSTSVFGNTFAIVGTLGAWKITQAASQQLLFGSLASTVGVSGFLSSTNAGDSIDCVCISNGVWRVRSSVGNITVA